MQRFSRSGFPQCRIRYLKWRNRQINSGLLNSKSLQSRFMVWPLYRCRCILFLTIYNQRYCGSKYIAYFITRKKMWNKIAKNDKLKIRHLDRSSQFNKKKCLSYFDFHVVSILLRLVTMSSNEHNPSTL